MTATSVLPLAALAVLSAGACARPARPDTTARLAPGRRAAALDSATARRLCAAPDSVLAGRTPCVLRDQAAPSVAFPVPRP